jgi:hypothetical protein
VVNGIRISNMNNVVAEIVIIAPCKEIHKELEKKEKTNIHEKLFHLFKRKELGTNGMLS